MERWNNTGMYVFDDLDTIVNFTASNPGYLGPYILDEAQLIEDEANYVTRWTGFFVPPSSGLYQILVRGDDRAKVFFSSTDNPEDMVGHEASNFLKIS